MLKLNSWLLVSFVFKLKTSVLGDRGILLAISNSTQEKFCFTYFPSIHPLPHNEKDAPSHPLLDLTPWAGCDTSIRRHDIFGRVVIVDRPNCTLVQKAIVVQNNGGTGVLVVSPSGPIPPLMNNETSHNKVNITLALITETSLQHIKMLGPNISVLQYAPLENFHANYSLVIIWFMAVFSVTLGAFWPRRARINVREGGQYAKTPNAADTSSELPSEEFSEVKDAEILNVSPKLIIIFVITMCGMLFLLYFFYDYLVYVIIAMFCFSSTLGLYQCLQPVVLMLPFGRCRILNCKLKYCNSRLDFRQTILLACCTALTIAWFVLRKENYAWVMQDILGIAFTINMLNVIRLPSFKICTFLLVLLFFYDIFFVFITPLITKSGESIMVEVATGGSSDEQMPMVLKVPLLSLDPLSFCFPQYSLLGFGDILIPGLLVSYCYSFDVGIGAHKVYFISIVIAYGSGLIFTFVGLYLMSQAQPALLYLVPSMLIPATIISLCRKEFKYFWSGKSLIHTCDDESQATSSTATNDEGIQSKTGSLKDDPQLSTGRENASDSNDPSAHFLSNS